MTEDRGKDGYRGVLNRESVTIPEVLRPAGYRTYMCGKWHVTRFGGRNADRSTWPLGRGFEKFYGTIAGGGELLRPDAPSAARTPSITAANDPEYRPESYYYTDALSDNAVRFPPAAPGRVAREAVLPLPRLHRGPLADARPGGGDRASTRAGSTPGTPRSARPGSAG